MILTIDQSGTITTLHAEALPQLAREGRCTTRRASHVLPVGFWLRQAFRLLRLACGERGAVAGWTRGWRCRWRVQIVGGPSLGEFSCREQAIQAEVSWLEHNYFGGNRC